MENHVHSFAEHTKGRLVATRVDPSSIDCLSVGHNLQNLNAAAKRMKEYERMLNYVKPCEVHLGKYYLTKSGRIGEKFRVGYIIPLRNSLQNLLDMPEVWQQIVGCHHSRDDYLYEICDGSYVANHPLFRRNSRALQIILTTDDQEMANPLRSHVKKHKIMSSIILLATFDLNIVRVCLQSSCLQ
jgi:hypothetical protein